MKKQGLTLEEESHTRIRSLTNQLNRTLEQNKKFENNYIEIKNRMTSIEDIKELNNKAYRKLEEENYELSEKNQQLIDKINNLMEDR